MTDYRSMYLMLFNAVTDALRYMKDGNAALAGETLVRAQQGCEEIYIETTE